MIFTDEQLIEAIKASLPYQYNRELYERVRAYLGNPDVSDEPCKHGFDYRVYSLTKDYVAALYQEGRIMYCCIINRNGRELRSSFHRTQEEALEHGQRYAGVVAVECPNGNKIGDSI